MSAVIDFIMNNYIWFLVGAIIILLAIIGRFADKSNFGRGDRNNKDIKEEDFLSESNEELSPIETETKDAVESDVATNENVENIDNEVVEPETQEPLVEEKQEEAVDFEKLDEEFDSVIPKKGIESEGLLEDIDKLSLDKTQSINLSDIPVLDDVDLPEIKDLRPDDEDVWKF